MKQQILSWCKVLVFSVLLAQFILRFCLENPGPVIIRLMDISGRLIRVDRLEKEGDVFGCPTILYGRISQ